MVWNKRIGFPLWVHRLKSSPLLLPAVALIALFAASTSLFLLLQVRRRSTAEEDLAKEVATSLRTFAATAPKKLEFTLEALPAAETSPTLLNPAWALPHLHRIPYETLRRLTDLAKHCTPLTAQEPGNEKQLLWIRSSCGETLPIPKGFFEMPPFMDAASGKSYALLAFQKGGPWRQALLENREPSRFFHVSELRQMADFLPLTPSERATTSLSLEELRYVNGMAALVVSRSAVFISTNAGDSSRFLIFDRKDWDAFLARSRLHAGPANRLRPLRTQPPSSFDSLSWSNVVFSWNRARERQQTVMATSGLLLAMAGLACSSGLLARKAWNQKAEERRRRLFDLKMLAHEMRTPATSLRLAVGELEGLYDALPAPAQVALLRIQGAEAHLGNVLEASQRYLKLNAVAFRRQAGDPSPVGELLESVVSGFEEGAISIEMREPSLVSTIDSFWFSLCVGNVISNALRHGKPPVMVWCEKSSQGFIVGIRDGGQWKEPCGHPSDSANARGLGFGLELVGHILAELGGSLSMETEPATTVLLHFPKEAP